MTIDAPAYPHHLSAVSDGSVAGTRFFDDDSGEVLVPADVTVQQEGVSSVRVRFAPLLRIGSFVMGPGDTLVVNRAVA